MFKETINKQDYRKSLKITNKNIREHRINGLKKCKRKKKEGKKKKNLGEIRRYNRIDAIVPVKVWL